MVNVIAVFSAKTNKNKTQELKTMSRIKIIAFEGANNSGKSTLAEMLSDYSDIELIKFPNERLDSGKRIRSMLNGDDPFDPEYLQELHNENKIDTLNTIVPGTYIFDMFKLSEIVYGLANDVPGEYVRNAADLLPDPEITFLLTGKSYGYDADIYGNDEYQSMITKMYLAEAKNSSGRIKIINNEKSIDEVFGEVMWELRGIDL